MRHTLRLFMGFNLVWMSVLALLFGEAFLPLFEPVSIYWSSLQAYLFGSVMINTLALVFFSVIVSIALGVTLAYLVTVFDFKGKRFFRLLFYMPLAFPPYVLAYIWSYFFGYTGDLQRLLRALNVSFNPQLFNIEPLHIAIGVYALSLFPYVYIAMKNLLENSLGNYIENARLLNHSYLRILFSVVIPLSLGAILSGSLLVALEVLSDYGVIAYLGIPTFSSAIFRAWIRFSDFNSALRLALILMVFALTLVMINYYLSRRIRNLIPTRGKKLRPHLLQSSHQLVVLLFLSLFVFISLILPLFHLVRWSLQSYQSIRLVNLSSTILNSLGLSIGVSLLIVVLAFILANYPRMKTSWWSVFSGHVSLLGYSIPGAVIAILSLSLYLRLNVLFPFGFGLGLLVFALTIRYTGLAYQNIEIGFRKVGLRFNHAAQMLRHSYLKALLRVDVHMMRPALIAGFILVFLDLIKELPLTLILRPFNFNTLATMVHQYANDEMLAESALPALIIIVLSIGFVFILTQKEFKESR